MKDFLEKLSAERYTDLHLKNTMNVASIFDEYGLDADYLYLLHFDRVPNILILKLDIDSKKAGEWFVQNYGDKITDSSYVKRYQKTMGMYFDEVYYFLFDDLLVNIVNHSLVKFLYRKTDSAIVEKMAEEISRFEQKKYYVRRKPEIELLVPDSSGLSTTSMVVTKPKFSIENNYNDDFLPVHQTILSRLQKKNDKGIVLLHGKPGTGKTSYIRYLITNTKKKVIFLPPNMATSVTDPGLMNVLINRPNSIFVIEDAENIIIDRNRSGSSSVSALLNLADGLLSDCLNIQIICSFNTDLSRVDSALTRKGRLIAKYEFTALEVAKAQALSNKLGFSSVISSPMTLAEVYNQNETNFIAPTHRSSVGFKIAV